MLLVVLLVANVGLMMDGSPMGVVDHQSAGTAANVNAIQLGWQQAGKLTYAKANMLGDLIFIGIYSFGALCGGLLMRADERLMVKLVGGFVILAAVVFCITDYVETIAQVIQLFRMQGADNLAQIVASVGATKTAAFVITLLGLGGKIAVDKLQSRE